MDLVVTSALASELCHSSFWTGKRKARDMKFCQYVWTHARFVKIYFDSSRSTVQVGSRSKNRQKMTNLTFELSWYFRALKSICRSVAKFAPTCTLSIETHSTRTDDAGWSYGTETICQTVKNDSYKMKICQKSFFGAIFDFMGKSDTENSNFTKIMTFV